MTTWLDKLLDPRGLLTSAGTWPALGAPIPGTVKRYIDELKKLRAGRGSVTYAHGEYPATATLDEKRSMWQWLHDLWRGARRGVPPVWFLEQRSGKGNEALFWRTLTRAAIDLESGSDPGPGFIPGMASEMRAQAQKLVPEAPSGWFWWALGAGVVVGVAAFLWWWYAD